jgi:UDP-N-acetylglucosamine diphosphorylase / glucose-1-phosphate thymidylyltransferase / UDP-N-acetylgalactosamine diphosphorylase / glucosamine-1-phosphate N-acetyltransferase / galactosamine-1-phosphate N-acetyltransferase
MDPKLILFDDDVARRWEPFALTRPAGELLFGTLTLRARAERVLGVRCIGHLAAEHLNGFEEPGAPPVLTSADGATDSPRIYLSSRFVPDWGGSPEGFTEGPIRSADGAVLGWYAPPGSPAPNDGFFESPERSDAAGRGTQLPGRLLENVWELIHANPDQIGRDVEGLGVEALAQALPSGAHQWGKHRLLVDPTSTIEPSAVFDTTQGPIWIDRDARVRAFTRLVGPAYVGPGSVVLGGPVEAVSVGPVCRVRGELAESVCVGYVNKQHDGHMGHAYLGRWVNLGAETTNSDLKNNYGTIRIWTPAGDVDTGEIKMGSLVGDHVKTGIGLLLNTGTVIGAGSNLYGAEMPPKYVPPFSWGTGDQLVEYRLDKFLEVAERAMSRRGVELSSGLREQLGRAWRRGRESVGTDDGAGQ